MRLILKQDIEKRKCKIMNMIVQIAAFTEQGRKTAYEIAKITTIDVFSIYDKQIHELSEWTKEAFENKRALIFVGAAGIAVRSISPYVKSKLSDSPVIVIDEKAQFVIPILSGHVGAANEMACFIAKVLGATPVITTATDINDLFSVDVFAVKNGLQILDKSGIQKISSKILNKEPVTISYPAGKMKKENVTAELIYVEYPPKINVDIIISEEEKLLKKAKMPLKPKLLILGIGCKKGASCKDIEALVRECRIDINQVCAVSSIDVKKDEKGIIEFANKNRIEYLTYSKDELLKVEGEFSSSKFVESTVGVDNVCERAALLCAGQNGILLQKKVAKNGVTLSVAQREWKLE